MSVIRAVSFAEPDPSLIPASAEIVMAPVHVEFTSGRACVISIFGVKGGTCVAACGWHPNIAEMTNEEQEAVWMMVRELTGVANLEEHSPPPGSNEAVVRAMAEHLLGRKKPE